MVNRPRSKFAWGAIWISTIVLVGLGSYLLGWGAEAKYEDLMTRNTPSQDVELVEGGRFDEAIQVVLNEGKMGMPEVDACFGVAGIYLARAKRDWDNREKWALVAVPYIDKAAASGPDDPFVLDRSMSDLETVGDYVNEGCPYYRRALGLGEKALGTLQDKTIKIGARNYKTDEVRGSIQPEVKRIQEEVDAWCSKVAP